MSYHTVKIEEAHYRYLEQAAVCWKTNVQDILSKIIEKQKLENSQIPQEPKSSEPVCHKKSRWTEISARIRKNPPLNGAGDFVRESAKEFREDFSFRHDTE